MVGFDQEQDDPNSTASIIRGIQFDAEEDDGLLEHHTTIQSSNVNLEREESTPNLSVVPASCSAINEANRITDASSSRNRDGSETMADKEEDRNDGGDEYDPRSNRGKRKLTGEEETSNSRNKRQFTNLVLGCSSNHPDSPMALLSYQNPTTNRLQHDSWSIRPEAGHNQRGPDTAASVNPQTQSHGHYATSSSTQQDRRIPQASADERRPRLNETHNPSAFENPMINEMRNQQYVRSHRARAQRPTVHDRSHRARAQGPAVHDRSHRARAQGPTFSAGQNQFNQPFGMQHRASLYGPDPMIYNHQHNFIPGTNQQYLVDQHVTSHRAQGPTSFAGQNQFNNPPGLHHQASQYRPHPMMYNSPGISVNQQNQYPQQNLSGHMPAIPQSGTTVDGNRSYQPPSMHQLLPSLPPEVIQQPPEAIQQIWRSNIPNLANIQAPVTSDEHQAIYWQQYHGGQPGFIGQRPGMYSYQGRGGRGRGTDQNLHQPKYQYGRGRGL